MQLEGLSGHERQARGEAPGREASFAITCLQLLGRRAEGRHEPGVRLVEGFPRRVGGGLHERSWGAGQLRRTILRIPREDRVHALLSFIQCTEPNREGVLLALSGFPG